MKYKVNIYFLPVVEIAFKITIPSKSVNLFHSYFIKIGDLS